MERPYCFCFNLAYTLIPYGVERILLNHGEPLQHRCQLLISKYPCACGQCVHCAVCAVCSCVQCVRVCICAVCARASALGPLRSKFVSDVEMTF